jgi:succinate dehydrogenase / fumarate reductase cytochrome b subunit
MPVRARPLSPHLSVYRWQIGNTLSILHRLTGLFLGLGFLALAYWFIALASDYPSYRFAAHLFASPIGLLALFTWTFAFFYHFLNGVRHLLWDVGRGFERVERSLSGWMAVIGAIILSLCVWILLWHFERL